MRLMLFVLLLALMPSFADAQDTDSRQAPFGLSWGASASDVRALGVELSDEPASEVGTSYKATKLPKVLSDAEHVWLYFGFGDKLWRIVVVSRAFDNDPSGTKILARYDELNTILSEKYGKAKSHHSLGQYADREHFAMYINGGRGHWFSDFKTPDMAIQLAIVASDLSTTHWRLFFEDRALSNEVEAAKKAYEKGTL